MEAGRRIGREEEQEEGSARKTKRRRELSQDLVEQQMEQQRQRAEPGGEARAGRAAKPRRFPWEADADRERVEPVDSGPSATSSAASLSPEGQLGPPRPVKDSRGL